MNLHNIYKGLTEFHLIDSSPFRETLSQRKMTSCWMLLMVVIALCYASCKGETTCNQDVKISYLNGHMYMVAKAKHDFAGKPKDCYDLINMGHHESDVYKIWPTNRLYENQPLDVYCDMSAKGGGWTVLQRRGNYGNSKDYFSKNWNEYKKGFGDIKKEFWLGNDKIYAVSNQRLYTARIFMRDVENNTKYAEYDTFWIDDENNKYTLHVSGYRGNAGDGLLKHHNNQPFSTKDKDNDKLEDKSCASMYKGGWWYNLCHMSNLNGLNHRGKHKSYADGIAWLPWKSFYESLDYVEIKIRPKYFKLP